MVPLVIDGPRFVLSAEYTFNYVASPADEKRIPETTFSVTVARKSILRRIKDKFRKPRVKGSYLDVTERKMGISS